MAQFIEFIGNNWILALIWVALFIAVIYKQQSGGSKSLGPQQTVMMINRSNAIVVDIRDKKEFETGHIIDAVNIPLSKFDQRITELDKHKDKNKPIVVVCKMGQHAPEACKKLQAAGHPQVYKLGGGISEWRAQSLPLVQK